MSPSHVLRRFAAYAGLFLLAACGASVPSSSSNRGDPALCEVSGTEEAPAPIEHLFLILLENKGFDETYGPGSPAQYLRETLVPQGQLLTQYHGTAHVSTGNYIALVSGQGPNPLIHADCLLFLDFLPLATGPLGQAVGQGCVFPSSVKTIADELEDAGLSWKGYMQDMALEKAGGSGSGAGSCVYPDINSNDDTNGSDTEEQYATRHNPFVFFHSIIDDPARCQAHDVDLEVLREDLKSAGTTPNYSFITPDNCHNAHDAECSDGGAGGLERADEFLKEWVPLIMASPAFEKGMIVILFDEANINPQDPEAAAACCGQSLHIGPNTVLPGLFGPGGGRTGALVLSPFSKPGSTNETPYNHYSLLRSAENLFGLQGNGYLGYAGIPASDGMKAFGEDVYNCGGGAQLRGANGGTNGGAFGAGLVLLLLAGLRRRIRQ